MLRLPRALDFLPSLGILFILWIGSTWISDLWRSAGIVFLFIQNAALLGEFWAPSFSQAKRWLLGILLALSWHISIQTGFYYLSVPLDKTGDLLTIALIIFLTVLSAVFAPHIEKSSSTLEENPSETEDAPDDRWSIVSVLIAWTATLFLLFTANKHGTLVSIRTPWPLLPAGFFGVLLIPFFASLLAAWKSRSSGAVALCTAAVFLSVTALTPLLYPNGYGFDGFLHRASETILLETGILHPKPPYYIGQYTLVIWLARLCHLPVHLFDIWLVPFFSLLPLLVSWILLRNTEKNRFFLALLPLFLPFAGFITTTPQALAYLLGFSSLLLAVHGSARRLSPLFPISLGMWAILCHPLGGLPFFGALLLFFWANRFSKAPLLRRLGLFCLWIGSALLIPFLFLFQKGAIRASLSPLADLQPLKLATVSLFHLPSAHLNPWVDLAATMLFALPLLLLAGMVGSLFRSSSRKTALPFVLSGTAFLLSGFILQRLSDFSFLITYERSAYADRLFLIASFLLSLPLLFLLSEILPHLRKTSLVLFLFCIVTGAGWHALHVYNSLPRHDAGAASYGWSVGAEDKSVVRWIDQQAQGKRYAVLANQTVSAAAIEAFGFKRYVNDVFYYPVPTGGPLYELFLKATKKDTDLTPIKQAATLTDSQVVFVVLNRYWWDADQVRETLSQLAHEHHSFDGGAIDVFRFDLP